MKSAAIGEIQVEASNMSLEGMLEKQPRRLSQQAEALSPPNPWETVCFLVENLPLPHRQAWAPLKGPLSQRNGLLGTAVCCTPDISPRL